jgi:hypothetical protein
LRLRTDIWVSAYLRQNLIQGRYGAVLRKGAEEAGAVYVVINRLDGTSRLFGPAPGPAYDENGERRWIEETKGPAAADTIAEIIAKRTRTDPDVWVVEIEDRAGTGGISA